MASARSMMPRAMSSSVALKYGRPASFHAASATSRPYISISGSIAAFVHSRHWSSPTSLRGISSSGVVWNPASLTMKSRRVLNALDTARVWAIDRRA